MKNILKFFMLTIFSVFLILTLSQNLAIAMPRTGFVLSPTEGETFRLGPFQVISRVEGQQSQGAFEMYRLTLGPKDTIAYHVHKTMDETLSVEVGQVEFNLAGKKFASSAGSVAFVPKGVHHGFTNTGATEAQVLITFTPSRSQNEYFRKVEKLLSAPVIDEVAIQNLQREYDQELVPPDA